jgi:hypothetical protein
MNTDDLNMEFFRALVEWSEDGRSCFRTYWTWAEHIGDAIERIRCCANNAGIDDPIVGEIEPVDIEDLAEESISNDDITFASGTVHSAPFESAFRIPYGVALSLAKGPHDPKDLAVGHLVKAEEEGLIELEAVVEEASLLRVYLHLVRRLPDIEVFWIKLHQDWEEPGEEEIYANSDLSSIASIESFLSQNLLDTVLNGYVTITAYSNLGQTNLNISDHKTIVIMGYDRAPIEEMSLALEEHGVPRQKEMAMVSCEYHHWHFRHPRSKSRADLVESLEENGFTKWDPNASE